MFHIIFILLEFCFQNLLSVNKCIRFCEIPIWCKFILEESTGLEVNCLAKITHVAIQPLERYIHRLTIRVSGVLWCSLAASKHLIWAQSEHSFMLVVWGKGDKTAITYFTTTAIDTYRIHSNSSALRVS